MALIPELWLQHFPASEWGKVADHRDLGELEKPLRDRLWSLMEAGRRAGYTIRLTSGYRTPWQQFMLRLGRVPRGQEFNPAYRGTIATATPGNSNHNRRRAADMDATDAGYRWIAANAARFGLALTVPGERWHLEARGEPTTAEMVEYPGPTYDGQGTQPGPTDTEGFGTMDDATIDRKFAALDDKLDRIIGGMMLSELADAKARGRIEDTTARVRKMWTANFEGGSLEWLDTRLAKLKRDLLRELEEGDPAAAAVAEPPAEPIT